MANQYKQYSSSFKHEVLQEYRPGVFGSGFKSLAKRVKVNGGHKLIRRWYHLWDGTVQSLDREPAGGRPRVLTENEVKHHILDFVESMNDAQKPVNYRIVRTNVQHSLDRNVSLRTIQRYGADCGIKWRTVRELTPRDGKSSSLSERCIITHLNIQSIIQDGYLEF